MVQSRKPSAAGVTVACLLSLLPAVARGAGLEELRAGGRLIWGADQEGGGPYVYPQEDDPSLVTGFEYDLAERLAEYLEVEHEFYQGPWDKMPDLLRTGKVQLVLNGYEWTPTRVEVMAASLPYYVYGLQLLVARDREDLKSWEDLAWERPGGKLKLGALTGSAAEDYLRERYGEVAEVISYDGNTDAMREVETGKLDATLQDTPIASFYAPRFPGLRPVGEPVGLGYYVMYARLEDRELIRSINEALILLYRSGEMERIYQKYGIWDPPQEALGGIYESARLFGYNQALTADVSEGKLPDEAQVVQGTRKRGWDVVKSYGNILLQSAGMTVVLSLLSFPLAVLVGLLVALGRMYGPRWLKWPLAAYVELLRGTPLMLQLYFVFFFLPEIGVVIPAFWTAILGLAVNYSAYESEIYRAGLQAVPPGQMEAALSLGMSRRLALRRIVVPQAVRIVIPPVVNDFIALFKDTSVCSVITIVELTKRFSVLSQSTQATVELMLLTALLYLLMSYPLAIVSRQVERRLDAARRRP